MVRVVANKSLVIAAVIADAPIIGLVEQSRVRTWLRREYVSDESDQLSTDSLPLVFAGGTRLCRLLKRPLFAVAIGFQQTTEVVDSER